jgi:DNA-directed RNA polymerase subunit RPC12/RpoP
MSKKKKDPWIVCPVCNGEETTVNPNIDGHGLTAEDFMEDPDFAEEYAAGAYDITCAACSGKRVVKRKRIRELEQNAEDRRLAARENGDFESYSVAGDWRFG